MRHIAGWFRRNNALVAEAKALADLLREAWVNIDALEKETVTTYESHKYVVEQMNRLANERFEERERRLAEVEHMEEILDDERTQRIDAQVALLDKYLTEEE